MQASDVFMGRRFVGVCTGVMILYVYGWCTRWTFDPAFRPFATQDHFFTAQADALLRGRLWVDPGSLKPGQVDECWYIAGRCYGYFGLTPSLLRIPVLLVVGDTTMSLAPILIPLAAGIAFGSSLDLCRQLAAPMRGRLRGVIFMCSAAVTLGPGSLLVLLADPYVYQEAIVWSLAFVALAVNFFWRWLRRGNPRRLGFSLLCCVLAAGARPTTLAVGVAMGIAVLVSHRGRPWVQNGVPFIAVGLIGLPVLFSIGTFFLKFDQPLPPASAWGNPTGVKTQQLSGPCSQPMQQHPRYVPTNLLAYLRPDAVRFWRDWPYVRFRYGSCREPNNPTYLWPVREGDMYVEKTTSLSNTMPIPLLALGAASFAAVRRRRTEVLMVLLVTAASGIATISAVTLTARYLGDFYPLLAAGLAMSSTVLGALKQKWVLVALTCAALLLSCWSVLANASLFLRYGWMFVTP